jgi:hypothetical protein
MALLTKGARMDTIKRKTAIGVFEDWKQGQNALHDLLRNEFLKDQLGIMARGGEDWIWDINEREQGPILDWNQASGSVVFGNGAEDLWCVGLAAGDLAGVGPTIAGGALTPVIQDNAGLLQELTHRGIPEGDARYYEDQFRRGKTLVLADDDARSAEAADIMHRRGAQANLVASNHSLRSRV